MIASDSTDSEVPDKRQSRFPIASLAENVPKKYPVDVPPFKKAKAD
jgi:hypothetical protein